MSELAAAFLTLATCLIPWNLGIGPAAGGAYCTLAGSTVIDHPSKQAASERSSPAVQIGQNCFDLFNADSEGHNWANAYLLALACHYSFPEKLDVSPGDVAQFQERFTEKFKPWGIDTFDFVSSAGAKFDTELVVMSKSDGDFVIVVFRGSENLLQDPVGALKDGIFTGAAARMMDVSEFLGEDVKVHSGFWNAFLPVRDDVVAAIEKQGGFSRGRKLWVTGNSLGAALANICAIWLRSEGFSVWGVYTYASPRCGNDRFRERFKNDFSIECQRWVNDNDIVPMLPPAGKLSDYRHVGALNHIKEDGSVVFDHVERRGVGNPLKHYHEFYVYRIYTNLPSKLRSQMPLPPPLPKIIRPFIKEES